MPYADKEKQRARYRERYQDPAFRESERIRKAAYHQRNLEKRRKAIREGVRRHREKKTLKIPGVVALPGNGLEP